MLIRALVPHQSTSGVYSLEGSTLSLPNCNKLNFEINGDELIINYPCIEPCRLKYHRAEYDPMQDCHDELADC